MAIHDIFVSSRGNNLFPQKKLRLSHFRSKHKNLKTMQKINTQRKTMSSVATYTITSSTAVLFPLASTVTPASVTA